MKKAKKEAADLKEQVHEYIAKVRSAEETLQEKVLLGLLVQKGKLMYTYFQIKDDYLQC
jgi:hypothetical protein